MNQDFSELVEYLDKKFSKVENRFINVDGKLVTIDDKIEKLQEFKADKDDVNELLNSIDAYAKKADTYFQEMVALAHKVDRHEKWILQIAEKLGIKLEY